jgi:hypothetical protein
MSTLRTNALEGVDAKNSITIVAGAGNITTTNVQQGLAMSWVNFDGTASNAAERDSFNLSSMTDSSTGNYVVNFSNNMGNGNFSGIAIQGNNSASNAGVNATIAVGHTASSASGIEASNLSQSNTDYAQISAVYHGDLA